MDARAMERVAAGGAVKTEEVLSRSDVKLGRGCGTHTFSLLLRTRSWHGERWSACKRCTCLTSGAGHACHALAAG